MKKITLLYVMFLIAMACNKTDVSVNPVHTTNSIAGWMLFTKVSYDTGKIQTFYHPKLYAVNLATGEKKFLFDYALAPPYIIKDKIYFLKVNKVTSMGSLVVPAFVLCRAGIDGSNLQELSENILLYSSDPITSFKVSFAQNFAGIISLDTLRIYNLTKGNVNYFHLYNSNINDFNISNKGNKIAYNSPVSGLFNILFVQDITEGISAFISDKSSGFCWSEDDNYLCYTDINDSGGTVLNKYNCEIRQIDTSFNAIGLDMPVSCNNGKSFIFGKTITNALNNKYSIWTANNDGSDFRQLTPEDGYMYMLNCCVSYYGRDEVYAFRSGPSGIIYSLISININTGAIKTLADNLQNLN